MPTALVIGLISGTSADGVDAALVRIHGGDPAGGGVPEDFGLELLGWLTAPYPPPLRRAVLRLGSGETTTAGEVCRTSFAVAGAFAGAALELCRQVGVSPRQVDLIGSHGQTVWHEPATLDAGLWAGGSTLQLGQPAVIAELTGIPTAGDFRPRDLAAGGQGAPLVPVVDYLLFRDPVEGRVLLNLGGIANLTALAPGAGLQAVSGFDTGPGNMLIDGAVTALTGGRVTYDRDGAMAAGFQPDQRWLDELVEGEPFYHRPPPKSTGRERFGPEYLGRCLDRARQLGLGPEAIVATLTELTAATVAGAIERYVMPGWRFGRVIASGGGVHNRTLMGRLARRLGRLGLELGVSDGKLPSDAKEAVAFAVLGWLTAAGRPGNLPRVTGAARPVVLGAVWPGDWRP